MKTATKKRPVKRTKLDREFHMDADDIRETVRVLAQLVDEFSEQPGGHYEMAMVRSHKLIMRPNYEGIRDRISREICLAIDVLEPIGSSIEEKAKKRSLGSILRVARLNVARDQ